LNNRREQQELKGRRKILGKGACHQSELPAGRRKRVTRKGKSQRACFRLNLIVITANRDGPCYGREVEELRQKGTTNKK